MKSGLKHNCMPQSSCLREAALEHNAATVLLECSLQHPVGQDLSRSTRRQAAAYLDVLLRDIWIKVCNLPAERKQLRKSSPGVVMGADSSQPPLPTAPAQKWQSLAAWACLAECGICSLGAQLLVDRTRLVSAPRRYEPVGEECVCVWVGVWERSKPASLSGAQQGQNGVPEGC